MTRRKKAPIQQKLLRIFREAPALWVTATVFLIYIVGIVACGDPPTVIIPPNDRLSTFCTSGPAYEVLIPKEAYKRYRPYGLPLPPYNPRIPLYDLRWDCQCGSAEVCARSPVKHALIANNCRCAGRTFILPGQDWPRRCLPTSAYEDEGDGQSPRLPTPDRDELVYKITDWKGANLDANALARLDASEISPAQLKRFEDGGRQLVFPPEMPLARKHEIIENFIVLLEPGTLIIPPRFAPAGLWPDCGPPLPDSPK